MPIREFRCRKCHEVFEALVFSPRDEAAERCPACDSGKLEVLFSLFGISGADKKVASSSNCTSCATHNCSSCG